METSSSYLLSSSHKDNELSEIFQREVFTTKVSVVSVLILELFFYFRGIQAHTYSFVPSHLHPIREVQGAGFHFARKLF